MHEHQLDRMERKINALTLAVADIARHLTAGSLTPEETAAVIARLTAHAVALEKIAAAPDAPVSPA